MFVRQSEKNNSHMFHIQRISEILWIILKIVLINLNSLPLIIDETHIYFINNKHKYRKILY